MNTLAQYKNGNVNVTLFENGTKIREFDGEPVTEFPESMDVKITNWCDANCPWCHEKSNALGKHANIDVLLGKLKELPKGIELAIGGGDAFSHPEFERFLIACKELGFVCNATVNQKHLERHKDLLDNLISNELIYGLGVSVISVAKLPNWVFKYPHVVFHVIMGINHVSDVINIWTQAKILKTMARVLVLGYKEYGLGLNYLARKPEIEENKYRWYVELASHFRKKDLVISFDNLAIKQMNLQRFFTKDMWDTIYQGEDGKHSMYVDAIEQQFAKSSTSKEKRGFDLSIKEFFKTLQDGV